MKKGMVFALVLLLVVSGLFAGGAKETSGPVVLKVGGIQTTEDPSTQALYKMAEIVEEKSGGRLKMDIYPASQLGSANAQVEAVSMGAQDMFVDAGWLGTYIPSKTIDAMWFIFEDADHYANYINSDVNKAMEEELMEFRQENGEPYRLIALPMADPVYNGKERLPATYANFLIVNNAVLVPAYLTPKDKQVREILKEAFPDRDIVSLNCLPLIKQHGSLHCITMQYPEGFMRKA